MFDFSPVQLLIVLAIALLVFGPRKLPEMARSVGRGIKEFRSSVDMSADDPPPASSRPPQSSRAVIAPADEGPDDDLDGVVVSGEDQPPGAR